MRVVEKRGVGVGEKSSRINSPHPTDREGGRKTTLITGEASRGGSRLVKSGLISPSTRGANHPQRHQGEDHTESLRAAGHGSQRQSGHWPGPFGLLWVLGVEVGVLSERLTH